MTKPRKIDLEVNNIMSAVSRRAMLQYAAYAACGAASPAFAQTRRRAPSKVTPPKEAISTTAAGNLPTIPLKYVTPNGALTPAPEPTEAQLEAANYIADRIRHDVAVAVASADDRAVPNRPVAQAVRGLLRNRTAAVVNEGRSRASASLARSTEAQRADFGRFAGQNARRATRRRSAIDPQLENLVRDVIAESAESSDVLLNTNTAVQIVLSDELYMYADHLTLNEPQTLEFKWETEESEATHAVWTITPGVGAPAPAIASGSAGAAPGGRFTIDFAQILPPSPPNTPYTYHIKVQPIKGSQRSADKIGNPSRSASITYAKSTYVQPTIEIEENLGHYQRIEFYVNKITCVEESNEASNSDEILLGGFFALADGTVDNMGQWTVSTDFDAGESEPAPSERPVRRASFKLFHKDFTTGNLIGQEHVDDHRLPWPRTYTFNLTMGERDDGGFGEMMDAIIQELLGELEPIVKKYITNAVTTGIGALVGTAFGPLGTAIGAAIGAIAGEVIKKVFDFFKDLLDNEDDILDERLFHLDLPSSRAADIHKLRGSVKDLPNGKTEFVSDMQTVRFSGLGAKYDVEMFWKATSRVFDY